MNIFRFLLSLVLLISFNSYLVAQEAEEEESVEEVVVTGSRIATSEFEGAQPVLVIDQEDIQKTGEMTISDVLRETPINTYGSFYERSGSSAGSQSTLALRGLGSSRTLVLIDGKRLPGSPKLGGDSANLNLIPTAAIERVEILADGASAVYGSDAIGGVVNVITKKGFDGMNFSGTLSSPEQPGGGEETFSFVGGMTNDNSQVTFTYEHQERAIIFLADRPYDAGRAPTDGDYSSSFNVSTYAYNYRLLDDWTAPDGRVFKKGTYFPDASCAGDSRFVENGTTYTWGNIPTDGVKNTVCLFDYTKIMAQNAGKKFDAFTVNTSTNLGWSNFYSRIVTSRNEAYGRYAPPAAFVSRFPAGIGEVRIPASDGFAETTAVLGVDAQLRKRFIEIGPRESFWTDWTADAVAGFNGTFNGLDWDVSLQYNKTDYDDYDCCYLQTPEFVAVSAGIQADGVFNGWTSPFDPEAVAYYTASPTETASSDFRNLSMSVTGELFPGTQFAAGYESANFTYQNLYDKQSEAGNVGGSSGNSDSGARDYTALYFETSTSLMDGRGEVQLAGRQDDYSDFGSNFSYTVKGLFSVMENLTVRASLGTGFKAPGLGSMFGATSFSADYHIDYVYCEANGIARPDCQENQVNTYISANPNLGPEESESLNFGVIYDFDFFGNHSVALDIFETTVSGIITSITVQDIIDATILGKADQLTSQGAYCTRTGSATGPLEECFRNPINGNDISVGGFDVKWQGTFNTPVGDVDTGLVYTQMTKNEAEAFFNGPVVDYVGLPSSPEFRYKFDVGYNVPMVQDLRVGVEYEYIDSYANNTDADYNPVGEVDSWTQVNLRANYQVLDNVGLRLVVRNLDNADPVFFANGGYDRYLHNNYGRVVIFGFNVSY